VTYAVRDDKPILFDPDSLAEVRAGLETPPGLEMLEQYQGASRWARLVQKVRQLLTIDYVPYPPDLKGWIEQLGPEALALEVGSGRRRLHPEIINLDIGPFAQVDVVADGAKLPFLDGSLDMVILDVVLEHVKNPGQFMEEARRVLKVGGLLYVAVPFVHPYHGYPADYHRFSRDSLGLLMEGFTPFKSGVLRGPMVALLNCFSDLPFLFTFSDNPKVYQATKGLALAFTFWLKYLDKLLVKNPQAHRLAHSLYFLGRKAG
jgi:SAM-dependent methyltransferase